MSFGQDARRKQHVELEDLFDEILRLREDVAEVKATLRKLSRGPSEESGTEARVLVYYRDGAKSVAKELLAATLEEYMGIDRDLGSAIVAYGTVHEGVWHALVLQSKALVR